jgi:carbon storage regulator
MLVLTRKSNQSIMIGDDIEVSVLSIMGEKVRIGIQAPQEIPVFRKEIYLEIHREEARRHVAEDRRRGRAALRAGPRRAALAHRRWRAAQLQSRASLARS